MLGLSCLRCLCLQGEYVAELGQDIEHWACVSAFSPCVRRNFFPFYPTCKKPVFFPCSLLVLLLSVSLSSGSTCIQSHSKWFCESIERVCNVLLLEWMKKPPLFCVMMRRTTWYLPCCFVSCIWLLSNCYHTVSKMLPFLDAFLPCLSLHKSLECGSRMSPWNIFVC